LGKDDAENYRLRGYLPFGGLKLQLLLGGFAARWLAKAKPFPSRFGGVP